MTKLTRRSLLRGSAGLAAAGLARPYLANAQAKTATVWWTQGFAQEEDIATKKIIAEYEKASGNTIDLSIVPYAPERQKIVSAITSGEVPDLITANQAEIVALYAWQDKLVDVSDVVATQRAQYSETALLSAHCYNSATKQRSFYGVQRGLRAQGDRNVYGLGLQVTSNGVDPNNTFHYFLIAYGGQDILTKD